MDFLTRPWPWYVAGPIIGLTVPLVYLYAGRKWGISSTFRDVCAATLPRGLDYFDYSWRNRGGWRLVMALGLIAGGFVAGATGSGDVAISQATRSDLAALGIRAALLEGWSQSLAFRAWREDGLRCDHSF